MSAKLFIGNLAPEITSIQLQTLFSTAGDVDSCRVITDRATGLSKGFAFIEMRSVDAASAATEKFNGHILQGKTMKVNEAKPRI
ncbi:MAG: RNA-binding protein [Acidobacteria bacterium]|nr:RNA-binding protein [Acidobacteriota bacterium]